MTWSEGARFLSRERARRAAGGDPERLRMLGWGDAPADAPLAMLDPIDTARGARAGAVACVFHPVRWAELEPELAAIVDEFQLVEPKAISARDYRRRSNFELEALATMGAAVSRERARRQKTEIKAAQRRMRGGIGGSRDDEELEAS